MCNSGRNGTPSFVVIKYGWTKLWHQIVFKILAWGAVEMYPLNWSACNSKRKDEQNLKLDEQNWTKYEQNYGIKFNLKFEYGGATCLWPPQIWNASNSKKKGEQNSKLSEQNWTKYEQNYDMIFDHPLYDGEARDIDLNEWQLLCFIRCLFEFQTQFPSWAANKIRDSDLLRPPSPSIQKIPILINFINPEFQYPSQFTRNLLWILSQGGRGEVDS